MTEPHGHRFQRIMDRVEAEISAASLQTGEDRELSRRVNMARLQLLQAKIKQAKGGEVLVFIDCPTEDVVKWYRKHLPTLAARMRLTHSEQRRVKRNIRPRVFEPPRPPKPKGGELN